VIGKAVEEEGHRLVHFVCSDVVVVVVGANSLVASTGGDTHGS
jgi:hypothetical protein